MLCLCCSSSIAAQAAHETGNFTSAIFLDCNNAFGYKAVTSSCASHPDYQNYANLEDSVNEICQWILRRLNEGNFPPLASITTAAQYAAALKNNGYYEDSLANYTNGILAYLNNFSIGNSFFLVAAIAAFFILKRS